MSFCQSRTGKISSQRHGKPANHCFAGAGCSRQSHPGSDACCSAGWTLRCKSSVVGRSSAVAVAGRTPDSGSQTRLVAVHQSYSAGQSHPGCFHMWAAGCLGVWRWDSNKLSSCLNKLFHPMCFYQNSSIIEIPMDVPLTNVGLLTIRGSSIGVGFLYLQWHGNLGWWSDTKTISHRMKFKTNNLVKTK